MSLRAAQQLNEKGEVSGVAYLKQAAALGLFFGGAGVFGLRAAIRPGGEVETRFRIHRLFAFYRRWLQRRGLVRLEAGGLDGLRDLTGTIIACNHPSLLDAVFMLSYLPNAVCIMRAGLMGQLIYGPMAKAAGYVPNDSGPGLIRQSVRRLREGANVLVFPEGTRTVVDPINRFKTGFALVALKAQAPIQTLVLQFDGTALRKGHGLFERRQIPMRVRIELGGRFEPAAGEPARKLAARIENHFRRELLKVPREV